VATTSLRKALDKVGLGWICPLPDELPELCLSDVKAIYLEGNFDLGFALGNHSRGRGEERRRTPLGELVHRFKYERDGKAGALLAHVLAGFVLSLSQLSSSDVIITVPPSFRSRPFDPVSFLAEEVHRRTQIPWDRNALKRVRLTRPQKGIRELQIKELNASNVYQLAKPLTLGGKKVLLLDDTFDSGATLDQISGILREAGAERIYTLVLAKTQGFLRSRSPNP
jgi:predicted amidophosphoribosyltransferase